MLTATSSFPIDQVRRRFPALQQAGRFLFFDNAAGAQIPGTVLQAVTDHLLLRNVQRGAPYRHSREVDAMIARARESGKLRHSGKVDLVFDGAVLAAALLRVSRTFTDIAQTPACL